VCDPCSQQRVPLPSVGITVSVRVCDRCYNDQSGSLIGQNTFLASSFIQVQGEGVGEASGILVGVTEENFRPDPPGDKITGGSEERPERQRDRRSLVVDELASRIHSTVTCT
jgi:hypothetical protein